MRQQHRCRDGKHGSCVGEPCECGCHPRPVHSMTIEMGNRCGATGPGSRRATSLAENVTCSPCRQLLDIQEATDRG
jgi:hypothetical protein